MPMPHDDVLDLSAAAGAPLVITYVLSAQVSFVTTVTGDARQYATTAIMYSSLLLWSGTMTQGVPVITVPFNLVAGSLTIDANSTFTLTVPSPAQFGSVVAKLTLTTPTQPQVPFQATIASWPLAGT